MSFFDALLHFANFWAPTLGLGLGSATLAKLFWRHTLRHLSWRQLALRLSIGAAIGSLGGIILYGQDGKMISYGAMVIICALILTWSSRGSTV